MFTTTINHTRTGHSAVRAPFLPQNSASSRGPAMGNFLRIITTVIVSSTNSNSNSFPRSSSSHSSSNRSKVTRYKMVWHFCKKCYLGYLFLMAIVIRRLGPGEAMGNRGKVPRVPPVGALVGETMQRGNE